MKTTLILLALAGSISAHAACTEDGIYTTCTDASGNSTTTSRAPSWTTAGPTNYSGQPSADGLSRFMGALAIGVAGGLLYQAQQPQAQQPRPVYVQPRHTRCYRVGNDVRCDSY